MLAAVCPVLAAFRVGRAERLPLPRGAGGQHVCIERLPIRPIGRHAMNGHRVAVRDRRKNVMATLYEPRGRFAGGLEPAMANDRIGI